MKLTRKQLILIVALLAALVVAIVAIVAVLVGKDAGKPAEGSNGGKNAANAATVTYVRSEKKGEKEIEAEAVRTGDSYWVEWATRENVVRGTYDDAAGTMENWGDELPLCDAGLAGVQDYAEGYEWETWWEQDVYCYSDGWTSYFCEFNRQDKTYIRTTDRSHTGFGYFYYEVEGDPHVIQMKGEKDSAEGGIYRFKDGLCYGYEASMQTYEKREIDGKKALVVLDYGEERIFEDRGDSLYYEYEGVKLDKVSDICYVSNIPGYRAYLFLIDDHRVVYSGGSMDSRNDVELYYEPGKRLEIALQGQTLGCRVEGDVLVANITDYRGSWEYRLARQGVDPATIDPAALLSKPAECELCGNSDPLKPVNIEGATWWVCDYCEEWAVPNEEY